MVIGEAMKSCPAICYLRLLKKRGVYMSYIALYREWRPKAFQEIVGQEHITRTLKNQIKQGRVAHAYLLCGTRGTGKTTTAKVFAKAVNCMNPVDGEPCGICEICKGIDSGNLMDVVEIDAASNNGVDNIRELRDDVKYLPSKCKYKVYIIDEVHMLSTAAFNALLKTLEEPPAHIVFILATTEFQKVPATIVSRCQRFDFKRIKMADIIIRLKEVADEITVKVDDKTLSLIARNADGALRDALSIFDQCISVSGENIIYEDVLSILGITSDEYLFKVADTISSGAAAKCLSLIDELIINGKDVYQFIKDITMHFRNLLISRMGDSALNILNVSEEVFEELRVQTKKFSTESILRNINILSTAEADAKWVSQPRIILEMAVLKMCKRELNTDIESLLDRILKLESAISGGVVNNRAQNPEKQLEKNMANNKMDKVKAEKQEPEKKTSLPAAMDISLDDMVKKWPEVLNAVRSGGHIKLWSNIRVGNLLSVSGGVLTIGFDYDINKSPVEEGDSRRLVEDYISSICEVKVKIRCIRLDEVAVDKQKDDDEIVKKAYSIFGEDIVEVEE